MSVAGLRVSGSEKGETRGKSVEHYDEPLLSLEGVEGRPLFRRDPLSFKSNSVSVFHSKPPSLFLNHGINSFRFPHSTTLERPRTGRGLRIDPENGYGKDLPDVCGPDGEDQNGVGTGRKLRLVREGGQSGTHDSRLGPVSVDTGGTSGRRPCRLVVYFGWV